MLTYTSLHIRVNINVYVYVYIYEGMRLSATGSHMCIRCTGWQWSTGWPRWQVASCWRALQLCGSFAGYHLWFMPSCALQSHCANIHRVYALTRLSHTYAQFTVHPTPCCPCPYRIGHCCCMLVRLQQRFHHVQPRVVLGGAMQRQVAMQRNSNNHEHYQGRQQQYKADSLKALSLLPAASSSLLYPSPPSLTNVYTNPSQLTSSLTRYVYYTWRDMFV